MHGVLSEEVCRDLSVCWDMPRNEAVTRGNGWWEGVLWGLGDEGSVFYGCNKCATLVCAAACQTSKSKR